MKLQEITANIRLRSPWEAIDLGFAMVQTWWKSIYLPLTTVTFTFATVLYLLTPTEYFWVAGMIFWWFKPLYDRLVLHIISHKLFNNELSSWQALTALPSLMWNTGFFQSMTFRRLSMSRGFNLPVWQLEQLRGKPRAKRQGLLHLAAHSQAAWLTIALAHLELFLVLSLFMIMILFIPDHIQSEFFDNLFDTKKTDKSLLEYINYIFYVLVVTLVHPFYIAGSFALYINRRTQLESWDIELEFKKIGKRLQNLTMAGLSCFAIGIALFSHTPTIAAEIVLDNTDSTTEITDIPDTTDISETEVLSDKRLDANKSKKIINEVMLTKNLDDKRTVTRWVKKKKEKKEKKDESSFDFKGFFEPIARIISFVIEFGLWFLIAFLLFLLYKYRNLWMHLFQGTSTQEKVKYKAPEVMFGMDIRPESLPEDIVAEARTLWENGKQREALSLLYRGALARLINNEKIKLENSYTEGDVLRHCSKQLTASKQSYLKALTSQWTLIAYAHRSPSKEDMLKLFEQWHSTFAVTADSSNGGHNE